MTDSTWASPRILAWVLALPMVLCGCPGAEEPVVPEVPLFDVVPGSTHKICQLTGEWDFGLAAQAGVSSMDVMLADPPEVRTVNRTLSSYQLFGTDLGSSFEHDGKLWFLFGDSFSTWNIPGDPEGLESTSGDGNPLAADATAFTEDDDPADCVSLRFLTQGDTFPGPQPAVFKNPDFDVQGDTVQQDGVSIGGKMYVWFSAMSGTGGSSLAVSGDNAWSFDVLYPVSTTRFTGIQAVLLEGTEIPGLSDEGATDWVLLFGTDDYRSSDLYLAAMRQQDIEQPGSLHYFAGLEDGLPTWSDTEADAVAIVDTDSPLRTGENPFDYVDPDKQDAEGCVGEFSVHYSPAAEAWITLYNCENWSIEMHSAALPWGPWSAPTTVVDPVADGAYCNYMHMPQDFQDGYGHSCSGSNVQVGDRAQPGSPYGPYVIERYTEKTAHGVQLYFVLSTWHPYNTVVMTTEIQRLP